MPTTAPEGWRGPFAGRDRFGDIDHEYYQCVGCGVEVTTNTNLDGVNHADDCEVAE